MCKEINRDRRRFLTTAAMTIAATSLGIFGPAAQQVDACSGSTSH